MVCSQPPSTNTYKITYKISEHTLQSIQFLRTVQYPLLLLYHTPYKTFAPLGIPGRVARDCYLHTKKLTVHTEGFTMSRKSNRNNHAPIGAALNPLEIDHASGHKRSRRNQPRLDQSSRTYTEGPTSNNPSSKHEGGHTSHSTPSDDDADGDVSNVDAAEPDDESDEDGEGDAFAPSGRSIQEHGDQAGRINEHASNHDLAFEGNRRHGLPTFKGKGKMTEASDTLRDSDDDVYNRVDLISDSEEDEPNVEQLEEKNIIESEEANDCNIAPAYRERSDGWEDFELEDGLFLEDVPYFDEQYDRTDSNILESEMELFQSASIFDGFPSPAPPSPSPRRVRFKEPVAQLSNDSDMDSDNGDMNILFRSVAAPNPPSGGDLDLGGPYLDYENDDGSSVGSSSGYESGLHDMIISAKLTLRLFS